MNIEALWPELAFLLSKRRWEGMPERPSKTNPSFACRDTFHNRDAYVFFFGDGKLNVKAVRQVMVGNPNIKIITLISEHKSTTFAKSELVGKNVILDELTPNLLMCARDFLSNKNLKRGDGQKIQHTPRLLPSDRTAQLLSALPGDVVHILNTSTGTTKVKWV